MANKINVKLILELRDAKMSQNSIASTRHISRHSVSEVFHKAAELGITYRDVYSLDENEVYRMFFPDKYAVETLYKEPDYDYVHKELRCTGVTLKLLWQKYKEECLQGNQIPMGYTKYCEGYKNHVTVNKLTNHLDNKPGVKTEVDWSGPTMSYVDTSTGEIVTVYLFVIALPYSQYAYVEPTKDMKMDTFIRYG